MLRRFGVWAVLLVLLALGSAPARVVLAQGGDAARAEGRVHFQRGVELYEEGRLPEALAEFEEAYRISPAPILTYNIAQLHAELGHAVEAADAYRRLLADREGGASYRDEATRELAIQEARIGRVAIEVTTPGARIFLDDVEIGVSPLAEPVRASAGEHVAMAQAAGFETQRHRFRVAGGATYTARLELVPSGSRGASLRIECRVPGVDVRVDGVSMGLTPLAATVPVSAGTHRVEGVREGYVPYALDVAAVDGSETRVVVVTSPDEGAAASTRAPLRIALPAASSTVRIDGEAIVPDPALEVPVGLHDVEIRVAEREPVDVRVDVLPDSGFELTPGYTWTPDARHSRIASADANRVGGAIALSAGLAFLGAGVGLLVWDIADQLASLNERAGDANVCGDRIGGTAECLRRLMLRGYTGGADAFLREFEADTATYELVLGVSVAALVLGAGASIVGIALLASAPSTADIDRGARADFTLELDVGPGHLGLHGTF